jgi:hypothetical protein
MASTSETGHAINVAKFQTVISYCTGYGSQYNPAKAALKLVGLNAQYTAAETTITDVISTGTTFISATNAREIAFEPIKRTSTQIINALQATDASAQLIKDAKTINRKIQGKRKGKTLAPPPPPVPGAPLPTGTQISVSQQSYDSILDNFQKLISLAASESTYTPNETPIKITTLNTVVSDLTSKNTACIDAATALSNARIARNKALYFPNTGLVPIAQAVKKYVLSIFNASSPQFKQVRKVKFTMRKYNA